LTALATITGSDAEGSEERGPARFGQWVAAGDLNTDGVDDLVVSAPTSGIFPRVSAGDVYVLTGPILDTELETVRAALTLRGRTELRAAGSRLALSDMNDDGLPDVAVTALGTNNFEDVSHGFDPQGGAVYLIDATLRGERELESSAFLTLVGPPSLGFGLAAGDYDGDGKADLIVSCPLRSELYVLRGPRFGTRRLPDEADVVLFRPSGSFGAWVSAADVDRDGRTDLAVNDWSNNTVYVLPGGLVGRHNADSAAAATRSLDPATHTLSRVLLADLTGDAAADVLLTARRSDSEDSGALFVFEGSPAGAAAAQPTPILVIEDIPLGLGGLPIAVCAAAPDSAPRTFLALGLAGRSLIPDSNQRGEVWLLDGGLRGAVSLRPPDVAGSAWRVAASQTDFFGLGASVSFAAAQTPGRIDLIASAAQHRRGLPNLGGVIVFELPH
jgi:hypothetical protein